MDMVRNTLIEKDHLLTIQEGLMGFVVDEVVYPKGKHHYQFITYI
jgi:hypothetical protein